MGLWLSAPPCFAADSVAAPGVKLSLRAAVAKLAASDANAVVRSSQEAGKLTEASNGNGGRSFVHSPKGIAAILLLAGGIAWAVVSRSNDAVHSPAKN
jgi:hypothetical protein